MQKEKRELMRSGHPHPAHPHGQQTSYQREPRGPFTFAAGWLGSAFDRSRIDKREAEERRSRNM